MKKYIYTAGAFAVALAMSGLPISALAEDTNDDVSVVKQTSLKTIDAKRALMASTSVRARADVKDTVKEARELMQERRAEVASSTGGAVLSEQEREELKQKAEQLREETKQNVEEVREEAKRQVEQVRETLKDRIELIREGTTTPARSLTQLKQIIENRRIEARDEAASTTPRMRKLLEGVAPMRVAVHALLASRELLGGGIGQQVSDIARQVDDSAATTTNAEARIQSRGFLARLLFGGDRQAASTISEQVVKNQDRIQKLTELLSEAGTAEDVKAELGVQVQAVQEEQGRLQGVAQSQSKLWGLFSWRF